MSKTEFKPEDFTKLLHNTVSQAVSDIANKLLPEIKEAWKAEMLKGAVVVYGYENEYVKIYTRDKGVDSQTKALLLNEEPIVKVECKHEPYNPNNPMCKHCGVELVAKWEPK